MSVDALSWAFRLTIPSTPKLVLLSLADRSNEHGWCNPSNKDTEERTGLTRPSISKATAWLAEHKLITVEKRSGNGGIQLSNAYWLQIGEPGTVVLRPPKRGKPEAKDRGNDVSSTCNVGGREGKPHYGGRGNDVSTNRHLEPSVEPSERKTHVQPAKVAVERVIEDRPSGISLFQEETDTINEPIPELMERAIERIPEKTKPLAASKPKVRAAPAPNEVIPEKTGFPAFWDAYPRKTGKLDAERKFAIACRRATFEQIMDGLARYQFSDDPKFIPHPATWLHQGRYLDVQVDLLADAYGLLEWHAALPRDGTLSAAMYDPHDLRPILIATGWEPSWRGSLDVLGVWMRDGFVPDSVAKTIAAAVAEFGARGNLAAFDKRVRYRAERISQ
jgi:hypothetical protein